MSDTVVLVRHIGGETVYDTTTFVTEDKTGLLLIFGDPTKRDLLAVYNASGWFSAEFIDKEVSDDDATQVCAEAGRTL
ncbi:hypothetical protein QM716_28450 [Rhodococcus sp. IEGM 1409]|uniref:hypothetical protein n=1 Tax=Rhodococcus sp. IEGM 1409 TaxID=3047082 RepID=UPI0024B723C8|nr:hypothetical protein [Rhodococcus sp. IEGM 1409]MDI9903801.1 hypothetical protein [Rhodococcus sp. IEGM 1409]